MNIKIILIFAIIILAFYFRFYDVNWDQNNHLQPDEREITLVSLQIHLPLTETEWNQVTTAQSSLNPKFFAYGSFPIYLLFSLGQLLHRANYDDLAILGRNISALFDIGTLIVIYLLGKKISNQQVGLWVAFFYSIAVLPIQLAHFYAVDTALTFFVTLILYCLVDYYSKPKLIKVLLIGLLLGLALATKISSLALILPILLTISFTLLKSNLKSIKRYLFTIVLLFILTAITFLIVEPFALIDLNTFITQNMEQQKMTKDAFTFPYTLQYVGIPHYLYQIKNIFLWGLGPILASLAFMGTIFITIQLISSLIKKSGENFYHNFNWVILLSFFWVYFGITGNFAIGFMRYMLPLYPLLVLFAALFIEKIFESFSNKIFKLIMIPLFLVLLLIWPISFINIYSVENTRVQATKWINQNIPLGGSIAVEHWDDMLPLATAPNYQMYTLPLYDPDTPLKWQNITNMLSKTDYIVIASNRLYVPLQKLTNCQKLPSGRCYPITSKYYQDLFNGSLGFQPVSEFRVTPGIKVLNHNIIIDDFSADESFTVYDHPKVMIFKNESYLSSSQIIDILNN